MRDRTLRLLPVVLLLALAVAALPAAPELVAQDAAARTPPATMRAFWHVFLAYAAVWLLILGWLVSIARRLARVERSIGE
jgi:CcmD family protein